MGGTSVVLSLRTRSLLGVLMAAYVAVVIAAVMELVLTRFGLTKMLPVLVLHVFIGLAGAVTVARSTASIRRNHHFTMPYVLEVVYQRLATWVSLSAESSTARLYFKVFASLGFMSMWDWMCCCTWLC
jgi:hypothetical protein